MADASFLCSEARNPSCFTTPTPSRSPLYTSNHLCEAVRLPYRGSQPPTVNKLAIDAQTVKSQVPTSQGLITAGHLQKKQAYLGPAQFPQIVKIQDSSERYASVWTLLKLPPLDQRACCVDAELPTIYAHARRFMVATACLWIVTKFEPQDLSFMTLALIPTRKPCE